MEQKCDGSVYPAQLPIVRDARLPVVYDVLLDRLRRPAHCALPSSVIRFGDELSLADVVWMLVFGLVGSMVSNSEQLKWFLDAVHDDASSNNPKMWLGKLLAHKGDAIDHVTRGGKTFVTYLHRLYGGHDPFSLQGDNPFKVLVEQHGLPKGILQAVRHLIADTFSKNGGVLPGSSFLDFVTDEGKVGNCLDEWARAAAKGSGMNPQQVYAELFAVKMQDIGATTVTDTLVAAYVKIRNWQAGGWYFSAVGVSELKIIACLTTVLASAGIGVAGHGGIPHVNIPMVFKLSAECVKYPYLSYKDLKGFNNRAENRIAVFAEQGAALAERSARFARKSAFIETEIQDVDRFLAEHGLARTS